MHKYIQIHPFLSPQPNSVIQEGVMQREGKATLMKSLYWTAGKLSFQPVFLCSHTPTPRNWGQKVLFGTPYPQDIAVVFSPESKFFCLNEGFEIQSLIRKMHLEKRTRIDQKEPGSQISLDTLPGWGAALQTNPAAHSKARTSKPAEVKVPLCDL